MEKFWEQKTLAQMSHQEWESLCDGCGLCCLIKLIDEDTDDLVYTRLVCRLLDTESCHCKDYKNRLKTVPDCVQFKPDTIGQINWLPESCAYKRIAAGKKLSWWHPLISGDKNSVHQSGISIEGWCVTESKEALEEPFDYIIEDPIDLFKEEEKPPLNVLSLSERIKK